VATAQKTAKKTTRSVSSAAKSSTVLSAEELAALKETVKERKAASRRRPGDEREQGERDALEKIAEMAKPDRVMAERIHAIVKASAPALWAKTWYGMPAYVNEAGKVVCFFKAASKYNERYASFGFDTAAKLDEGNMWPTSWALTRLTPADEKTIAALVRKAAG
jgi:uncharacterized protein YdhG (YjbR/CyaY superfamily)